jgi:hypothetical protein
MDLKVVANQLHFNFVYYEVNIGLEKTRPAVLHAIDRVRLYCIDANARFHAT